MKFASSIIFTDNKPRGIHNNTSVYDQRRYIVIQEKLILIRFSLNVPSLRKKTIKTDIKMSDIKSKHKINKIKILAVEVNNNFAGSLVVD